MLRVNSVSRNTPDAYGNAYGSMIPSGTVQSATDLVSKKKFQQQLNQASQAAIGANQGNSAVAVSRAYNNISVAPAMEFKPPKPEAITSAATIAGTTQAGITQLEGTKIGNTGKTMSRAGAGAIGAGAGILGVAGDYAKSEGQHAVGTALGAAGKGAAAGMAFGPIGAGVGAGVGLAVGAWQGMKEQKEIEEAKKKEKERVEREKKQLKEAKHQNITLAQDRDKMYNIGLAAQRYDSKGNLRFRKGGLLWTPVVEEKEIKEGDGKLADMPFFRGGGVMDVSSKDTKAQQKKVKTPKIFKRKKKGCGCNKVAKAETGGVIMNSKENTRIEAAYNMLSKGIAVEEVSKKTGLKSELLKKMLEKLKKAKVNKQPARTFKKGGKMRSCKKGGKCGCAKCNGKIALVFRRGGVLDLEKENVIVDGASHEDFNNTGIEGDKGLPVVMKAANGTHVKVAEIESDELVLNKATSVKIDDLRKRINKGDKEAKEELAELIHSELASNTYDYSNVLD